MLIESPLFEHFSYEVLSSIYTPDTGNNTFRLQFEIQRNNPNSYAVERVPYIIMRSDNIEFSTPFYSQNTSISCYGIAANSNCVLTMDIEDSLVLGQPTFFELIDVNYFLTIQCVS